MALKYKSKYFKLQICYISILDWKISALTLGVTVYIFESRNRSESNYQMRL